ncbi:MAG: hypothetical protein WAU11_15245 [Ignavibacteriaceae bacterium]
MIKYFVFSVFLFFIQPINIISQSFYELLGSSHYARVIRIGNAYAGVAEGVESIYYNVAGLANFNGYGVLYSNGHGYAFYIDDSRLNDFTLALQLPDSIGTAALSLQTFTSPTLSDDFGMYLYTLSFARKLFDQFSAGINVNYFYETNEYGLFADPSAIKVYNASAFDLSLGLLYELPNEFKLSNYDKFNVGFQIKNLLNNQLHYDETGLEHYLFQEIRLGLGYLLDLQLEKVYGFNPITIQLSADAVFQGSDYAFREWQPNYGIEITTMEIVQLSYGRENEKQIKKTYDYSPQHPVSRYGIGLNIPIERIINLPYKCHLNINYCISDWQKIDENMGTGYPFYVEEFDNNAFSVGVVITP